MIRDRSDIRPLPAPARRPNLATRAIFVLACGVGLAIPIARADGQTVDRLHSKLEAARGEAEALNEGIEERVVALAAARRDASAAAGREAELTTVLSEGRARSATLAEKLSRAEADLADAEARLDRALDALAERLVTIYKSGEASGIEVLLDADGFDDLATRAELLGRIQAADRALAERVRSLRLVLSQQVTKVERAKERSDALNTRVSAARDQIAAARAQAEARAEAAADARASQAAALSQLDGRMAAWSKQVERLERVPPEVAEEEVAEWNGTGEWAIPEAVVMCESGGNFSALNPSSGAGGAYQILPSTWELYGGEGLPHEATPAEQHRIAALIFADSGLAPWVCAG